MILPAQSLGQRLAVKVAADYPDVPDLDRQVGANIAGSRDPIAEDRWELLFDSDLQSRVLSDAGLPEGSVRYVMRYRDVREAWLYGLSRHGSYHDAARSMTRALVQAASAGDPASIEDEATLLRAARSLARALHDQNERVLAQDHDEPHYVVVADGSPRGPLSAWQPRADQVIGQVSGVRLLCVPRHVAMSLELHWGAGPVSARVAALNDEQRAVYLQEFIEAPNMLRRPHGRGMRERVLMGMLDSEP